MNRDEKTAVIEKIADQLQGSQAVFAVDYRGISVPQVAELRTKLGEADASFNVVKNSLTELAADKADVAQLKDFLSGPTALTFVRGDAAMAAKAIAQFIKEHELLAFKGGMMDGAIVTTEEIVAIAKLPSRDALYGHLVGMVASPLTGLVRSLNGLVSGLAIQLAQIAEQKQETSENSTEESEEE